MGRRPEIVPIFVSEVAYYQSVGKPVFHSIDDLYKWVDDNNKEEI